MNRRTAAVTLMSLLAAPLAAHATASRGTYHATVDGVPSTLALELQGSQVSGTLTEGAMRLAVRGTLNAGVLRAELLEPTLGLAVASMDGRVAAGSAQVRIRAAELLGGAERQVQFTQAGVAATAPAAAAPAGPGPAAGGAIDPRLVGRWVNESIINSGGANFASFNTVRTMELDASGQIAQHVLSAGGGGNWSFDGGRRLQFAGRWYARDGVLYLQPQQGGAFEAATRYRFAGEFLVTEDTSGRKNWRR